MKASLMALKAKEYMDAKGISITFVATKTGISIKLLSLSFLGKRRLLADELMDICKVLNVEPYDLMSFSTTA